MFHKAANASCCVWEWTANESQAKRETEARPQHGGSIPLDCYLLFFMSWVLLDSARFWLAHSTAGCTHTLFRISSSQVSRAECCFRMSYLCLVTNWRFTHEWTRWQDVLDPAGIRSFVVDKRWRDTMRVKTITPFVDVHIRRLTHSCCTTDTNGFSSLICQLFFYI